MKEQLPLQTVKLVQEVISVNLELMISQGIHALRDIIVQKELPIQQYVPRDNTMRSLVEHHCLTVNTAHLVTTVMKDSLIRVLCAHQVSTVLEGPIWMSSSVLQVPIQERRLDSEFMMNAIYVLSETSVQKVLLLQLQQPLAHMFHLLGCLLPHKQSHVQEVNLVQVLLSQHSLHQSVHQDISALQDHLTQLIQLMYAQQVPTLTPIH